MPKKNIDYSNTIIYKIYCKDEIIKDIYVGHTTNFVNRKYSHKIACNNLNNTLKIYNTIRNNGGWENWDMVEIAKYCCKDATEARIKEQFHYEELKSSLNSVPPYIDKTLYFCSMCNLQCTTPNQYKLHVLCNKHTQNMNNNDNIDNEENYENTSKNTKNTKKFVCIACDFSCFKKGDWNRHIVRPKHITLTMSTAQVTSNASKFNYICDICNKEYNSRNGLWNHKKKCCKEPVSTQQNLNLITPELIMELIKDNQELKHIISQQNNTIDSLIKNGITNNSNNISK